MKRLIAVFMVLASVLCIFTACSGSGEVVRVFNWGDYIDETVNEDFSEATGIDVKYSTFIQNEDMYTSVTAAESYYDVIVPSDYMISKMASEGLLAELNFDNIPNYSLISDRFKGLGFDPENKYAVPYLWGTVGIVYNKSMIDEEITSWSALFDEKYAGKIFMMDSVRDSIGIALIMGGHSVNSKNDDELAEAEALLIKQKPLVLAYTEDNIKDLMISGEGAMCVMYSGDAITVMEQNPDLVYVIPEEGSIMWYDCACVLASSENKENAEAYINYLCSTDAAQKIFEAVWYASPQIEVIAGMDEEQLSQSTFNPTDEELARCEVFVDLGAYTKVYNEIWSRVKG